MSKSDLNEIQAQLNRFRDLLVRDLSREQNSCIKLDSLYRKILLMEQEHAKILQQIKLLSNHQNILREMLLEVEKHLVSIENKFTLMKHNGQLLL